MAASLAAPIALLVTGSLLFAVGCDGDPETPKPVAPPIAREATALDQPLTKPATGDAAKAALLMKQALEFAAAVRPGDARKLFELALAADPAHLPALLAYGFLLLDKGAEYSAGAALIQFRLARLLDPEQPLALCGEGIARQEIGDLERAVPLLRAAIANPAVQAAPARFAAAQAALGNACATQGASEEALALLAQASACEFLAARNRAGILVRRADLLAELDRSADAEQQVRAALKLDPEQLRGHYLLAQLLDKRGAADEAKHEARIHDLLRQIGDRTTRATQDVDRRIALRRELVASAPEWTRAPYELVRDLLGVGRWSEALAEIGTLVRRDGATAESSFLTACAKAGAGDLDGAKAAAHLMFEVDRKTPPLLLRSILEYWRKGNPAIDAATFQRTLQEWMGSR